MPTPTTRLLLGAALSGVFFATTHATPARTETPAVVPPQPIAKAVVAPTKVPRFYINTTVQLQLTIDEQGRPSDIRILGGDDPALNRSLIPAVAQWRFVPAQQDGVPVKRQAILPLKLVGS